MSFAFVDLGASGTDDFVVIEWRDLTVSVEPADDPFFGLDFEQRRDLEILLDVTRQRSSGAVLSEQELRLEATARSGLEQSGLDPDGLIEKDRVFIEKIARQRSSVRSEWLGANVRIPGYVIPLEFSGDEVTEFLLVPYYGACIHTPPPPANQIIHVRSEAGVQFGGLFDAVWVSGQLGLEKVKQAAQLSDGAATFEVGYSLDAHLVERYEN